MVISLDCIWVITIIKLLIQKYYDSRLCLSFIIAQVTLMVIILLTGYSLLQHKDYIFVDS